MAAAAQATPPAGFRVSRTDLQWAAGLRTARYVERLRSLFGERALARKLAALGSLAQRDIELYILPLTVAESVKELGPLTEPVRSGRGKYAGCIYNPGTPDEVEIIITPDDSVESVFLAHEMEHFILRRTGAPVIRGKPETVGMAVEHFAVWAEEAAVSVRLQDSGFDPAPSDRERVGTLLESAGQSGEGLRNVYSVLWGPTGITLRVSCERFGDVAGLAYLAGCVLREADAAEIVYRARKLQVEEHDTQETRLPNILAAIAEWGLRNPPRKAEDIPAAARRFSAAIQYDQALLSTEAAQRVSHIHNP